MPILDTNFSGWLTGENYYLNFPKTNWVAHAANHEQLFRSHVVFCDIYIFFGYIYFLDTYRSKAYTVIEVSTHCVPFRMNDVRLELLG